MVMATFTISCPHCGQHIAIDDSDFGHTADCPTCEGTIVLPDVPEPKEKPLLASFVDDPQRKAEQKTTPSDIRTNVKQGAIIGGSVCFGLGLLCMFSSLFLFFLYFPLFVAAFILSIVAMSQRRVLGGVSLLVATLVVPAVLGVILFSVRTAALANNLSDDDPPTGFLASFAEGMEEAERKSDLKKLNALQERKAEYEKKLVALKAFRIIRANISRGKDGIGLRETIIGLTIQNDTGHPVKQAYFRGVLSSPGRSIPWVDDTFSYMIAGGVEPGEKADWRLAPNMFSGWGSVDIPSKATFSVSVTRLDGPDGEPLFGNARFDEDDEKRLEDLVAKYGSDPQE